MNLIMKTGGFRYDDGTRYIGDWNQKGQKHGMGHLLMPDGTRYGSAFPFNPKKRFSIVITVRNKVMLLVSFSP